MCVCVSVRACVHACVHACVCVCVYEDRSGTEAWKRAPRADYKKMSRGVLQGEQPEVGNSLLMVTPPGSPLPVTHAKDPSDEAKTCLTQMYHHTPKAPLTETTSLIYQDPRLAAERHHLDGWPYSKVQGVCVCYISMYNVYTPQLHKIQHSIQSIHPTYADRI